jgi:hypothetical protein
MIKQKERFAESQSISIRSETSHFPQFLQFENNSSIPHSVKITMSKTATHYGITIDVNPPQRNAHRSISSILEPLSKRTDSSDSHFAKLCLSRTTTDDGMTIDFNPLSLNANSSIRSSRESLSKPTD